MTLYQGDRTLRAMGLFFYRCLLFLAQPLVRWRLHRRARREPAYGERIEERFGEVPDEVPRGVFWCHAVSAGETIGAVPLLLALHERYPKLPMLVTTMTPTGSQQVRDRLPASVAHCYAPYDFPSAVRRFFDRVQPRLLLLMETELWPTLLAEARRRRVPVVLMNARLSARSARGYGRFASLSRPMLAGLELVCCQYPAHRQRFIDLGAPAERVLVTGNLKFDQPLPEDQAERVAQWRLQLPVQGRWCWIAASTHEGEDAQMLAAHKALLAGPAASERPLLLLVPRHPVRTDDVCRLSEAEGFATARLSDLLAGPRAAAATEPIDVIVGDTMGDLFVLYGLAHAAFVGGSLVDHGGHNPIEPALCHLPLLMGASRFNFEEVCGFFDAADALLSVADATAIAAALERLRGEPAHARALGARARAVVSEQAGVQRRIEAALQPLIDRC